MKGLKFTEICEGIRVFSYTGIVLDLDRFCKLVKHCDLRRKALILDFFRALLGITETCKKYYISEFVFIFETLLLLDVQYHFRPLLTISAFVE
jgi:hypothetical protein